RGSEPWSVPWLAAVARASSRHSSSSRLRPRSSKPSTPTTARSPRAWKVAAMRSSDREAVMRLLGILVAIGVVCLATASALAGDFDGSRVLICAPVQAFDCAAGEDCAKGLPDEIGAPAFMRIDLPNKSVVGPKRTSPILLADKTESQLVLQGTEL